MITRVIFIQLNIVSDKEESNINRKMTYKCISAFIAFTMTFQMNTLNVYAIKDLKEVQKATTSYDESSNNIKEELSKN